jgi:phenylacetate-CoA ligase
MVPLSIVDLNDQKLESIVQALVNDKKLHIILSYSSGLERLAEYIVRKNYKDYDFRIHLIIADSDNLKTETWDLLEEIFKCPVLNRYASIENAIIAITKPGDRTFYIDTTQFYVEVLKMDADVSVEEGEMGRIVVTDFHNKAMPFIRYANGDLAVAKKIINGQCVEIETLEGREISALRKTDGTLLSETNIMGRFKQFVEISRYQIIQTSANAYTMRLEGASAEVNEKCIAEMKKIFGDDAIVKIEHTDLIKCGKNGKFKVTISEV